MSDTAKNSEVKDLQTRISILVKQLEEKEEESRRRERKAARLFSNLQEERDALLRERDSLSSELSSLKTETGHKAEQIAPVAPAMRPQTEEAQIDLNRRIISLESQLRTLELERESLSNTIVGLRESEQHLSALCEESNEALAERDREIGEKQDQVIELQTAQEELKANLKRVDGVASRYHNEIEGLKVHAIFCDRICQVYNSAVDLLRTVSFWHPFRRKNVYRNFFHSVAELVGKLVKTR